jgi:short-subunit dehydrogenase
MSVKLKKLNEQVIVITGASSGIGLATARMAASRGARVVLCSRNIQELVKIVEDIRVQGGQALAVECDVTDVDAVKRVSDLAVQEFGGLDTWVNNAGATIYGKLTEVPMEEKRQLFEVNFWGTVNGCRAAVPVLRTMGGALINIGSVLSERAIPIQGMYSASKHAVKAYTDSLRMELEAEGYPISVSLVKPGPINTPYSDHAINRMDHHPTHTAPVYAPEIVAEAILSCATHPQRDIFVGGSAKVFSLMETFVPRLVDFVMEKFMMEDGQSNPKLDAVPQTESLRQAPKKEGQTRGSYDGKTLESSAYTKAAMNPGTTLLIGAGLGLAAFAGLGYMATRRPKTVIPDNVVRH